MNTDEKLRDKLEGALVNVLSNASNYPERVQSRLLGTDTEPLRTKAIDAILPIIAREVAAALKEAADAIDLESIATEWAGSDGSGHWSAGNAASEIRIQLHDRASHIERATK